ncbi:MAG: xanthine dehydrogenase small subunit [Bdellovibrionota bacterium]
MALKPRKTVLLYINGVRHEIGAERAGWMLADYLRYEKGLTGTKIVCAEGDCGACTVLRFFPGVGKKSAGRSRDFLSVNSCITTMAQLDGSSLVTIDALAKGDELSPVQEAMKSCHGSQCGFCTPGFVMALSALVEKKINAGEAGKLDRKEAQNALTGNLCRCTGYQQIVDAAASVEVRTCESVGKRFYNSAQEKELKAALEKPVLLEGGEFSFFAPVGLGDACRFLSRAPTTRPLASATDLGVVHNKGIRRIEKALSLHLVPELYALQISKKGVVSAGARVTLAELRRELKEKCPEVARFLNLFASPQIKNIATLVGNVANASPIADTPPFLLACNAVVKIAGPRGKRSVPLKDFYLGYRKTDLRKGELIAAIEFTLPAADELFALYKISERKDLDISCVNAGLALSLDAKGTIRGARLAFGGMAATPVRLTRTEKLLEGKAPSLELLGVAQASLQEELTPLSDVRGSSAFRRVLAANLLKRFFREKLEIQA